MPVLRKVQQLSLKGIAAGLDELIEKARTEKLTGADIKGGTFTISNHGVSGSLFAAPIIINQPQSAILGVGKLEKRVVVREVDGADAIQIRPMAYVTPDHRPPRRRRPPDQRLADPLRRGAGELAGRLSNGDSPKGHHLQPTAYEVFHAAAESDAHSMQRSASKPSPSRSPAPTTV